jgi:hypothetical protein
MDFNGKIMNRSTGLLSCLMLGMILFSCERDLPEAELLGDNREVIGTWVETEYASEVRWLERREELDPDRYGFTLRESGEFIEHKNGGWCATPPISYASFEGNWMVLSDSLLAITVGYWGGTMSYQIRLVSVEQDKLAIRYLYGEDRVNSK